MSDVVVFFLVLEGTALTLALLVIFSFTQSQRSSIKTKVEQQLTEHMHTLLQAELHAVKDHLTKVSKHIRSHTDTQLKKQQQELESNTQTAVTEVVQRAQDEMADFVAQQRQHVLEEIQEYRVAKITEIDVETTHMLEALLKQKVWKVADQVDKHAVAKQALTEILQQTKQKLS